MVIFITTYKYVGVASNSYQLVEQCLPPAPWYSSLPSVVTSKKCT